MCTKWCEKQCPGLTFGAFRVILRAGCVCAGPRGKLGWEAAEIEDFSSGSVWSVMLLALQRRPIFRFHKIKKRSSNPGRPSKYSSWAGPLRTVFPGPGSGLRFEIMHFGMAGVDRGPPLLTLNVSRLVFFCCGAAVYHRSSLPLTWTPLACYLEV